MECTLVPKAGFQLETLDPRSFRRGFTPKAIWHNLTGAYHTALSLGKARRLIRTFQPDVIVGTGGYASFPLLKEGARVGVPSRNFFYCLDFAVFLSMPMVQVLALLPGLWAVAQAVLLENWLALALSLASFWGGMTLTALALALAGRRKLRPLWKSILLYPLFTASWYPLHILAVFRKTKVWKPIAHRGQTARQLESSVR